MRPASSPPRTGPGCPTAGGTSSPPARRSGRCSTTTSATASASSPTSCCARSAGRRRAGFELTDEVRTLVAGHAALLALGLDGVAVRRRRHDRRARPGDAPHGADGRPGQGRADGRAGRRRRRGPPRRRPGDARVVVGAPGGRQPAARPRRRAPRVRPQARHARRHDRRHAADRRRRRTRSAGSRSAPAEYQGVRSGDGGRLLRPYAGTNPGEFFAVATETFFTLPLPMRGAQAGAVRRARRLLPPGPRRAGSLAVTS